MIEEKLDILFVDDQWCKPDERDILIASYGSLQRKTPPYNFHYETAEISQESYSPKPVLDKIASITNLQAIFLDIMFGRDDDRLGLSILSEIRSKYPTIPVFMMTSIEGDIEVLEKAMELGANEYLVKRPTLSEIENLLRVYALPNSSESDYAIWGNSENVRNLRAQIARVSFSDNTNILITGENGSGKELVARAIHRQGPRKRFPFIDKNCAHERMELLDDDLFGHEKGSFTGAERQHIGRFERADKGILFLDEIGSMPPELQGKLLRVLETKKFQRIGGTEDIFSDFQLICATNEDISNLIDNNIFRNDLYYRINHINIEVPPLRERRQDILILANLFLKKFISSTGANYSARKFSKQSIEYLQNYHWPGNVRELKNIVERSVILAKESVITPQYLPHELLRPNIKQTQDSYENIFDNDSNNWFRKRLLRELDLYLEAKNRIQRYRGNQWKAEFMRLLFPDNKAQSAKGFNDLIKRLTKGPWGSKNLESFPELRDKLEQLLK